MTRPAQEAFDFSAADAAAEDGAALIVELDGFEGPLHVLLALARAQKVDLLQISVTRLADQYLAFVHETRRARFALAADYLVMAAWLAYLKSRLLLPRPEKEVEPPAEELAARLAFRLARLDAMRRAAQDLSERALLGRDVFVRGAPEAPDIVRRSQFEGDLFELISAFARQRERATRRRYRPDRPSALPLEDARRRLRAQLPQLSTWTELGAVAPAEGSSDAAGAGRASCIASTLAAGLELVKEGALEARQARAFAALYLRARDTRAA